MIVCFDLETTWLDKSNDKIIEVSMVKFDEKTFEIIDSYSTFVNPGIDIPEIITNITNITNDDVKDAPIFSEIKQEILDFVWNNVLLWHNVSFDIDFFINNWVDVSLNTKVDTFFLWNFLTFNNHSLNLEMLCKFYWIEFTWAHRAINDVKATISLFKAQIDHFNDLTNKEKDIIYYILNQSYDKNSIYIKDLLFIDYIADINLEIFENTILSKVWRFCEDDKVFINTGLEDSSISDYFSKNRKNEIRENQLTMTNYVYDTQKSKSKVVIEAPTWLWKSYAYLIPSIIHSLKTWEKVYISTKTKNLQDQLFDKDLKVLKDTLWLDFNYTKLKWKRNYLSIKSFFEHVFIWNFSYFEVSLYIKISLWLLQTEHWEIDELNFYPDEFSIIKYLSSDWLFYLSDKNDYKDYEFINKVRKKVDSSNIIIINHSLLFSDLDTEKPILTWLKNLVIDEAHNIEDSITESLRDRYNLKSIIDSFLNIEKILNQKKIDKIDFLNKKNELINYLWLIDDYIFSYLNSKIPWNQQYKTILIKEDFYNDLDFKDTLSKIKVLIIDIVDNLKTKKEYDFTNDMFFIDNIGKSLDVLFDKESDKKFIKILSLNDYLWIYFDYTLLNPWDFLNKNLWSRLDSCVLTSATLSIWWSFDYVKNIFNLDSFVFHSLESDFDYKKQSTLFIPTDIWNIKNNSEEINAFLKDFYLSVKWNTLTLLTSFNSIKSIYSYCNMELKKSWINLYAQSIWWSKTKLLSMFLDNPNDSILLWTDSFWEWVDIPWEDLKYLVIHKFPFQVPTDPIFQARSVFFKDSFNDYSIPKAILKLKQWFWRLIRTKTDTGIVVLLDDRINSKWWSVFYNSFPEDINIKKWTKKQFIDILEKFN